MNERRIRDAFDSVRADEALRQRTRAFLCRRTRPRVRLKLAAALLCSLCLLVGAGGAYLYFTPTVIVSVDVNPSLEMSLNRFDRVIGLEAFNQDGAALADELDVRYDDFAAALSQILANERILQFLKADEELHITVAGQDEQQNRQILTIARERTAQQSGVRCGWGRAEDVEQAHACGLSHGKYQAGMELMALDETVTTEDIQQMTMKEIRTAVQAHHANGHGGHGNGGRQQHGGGNHDGHGSGGKHGRGH